jgi:hypothetical protein
MIQTKVLALFAVRFILVIVSNLRNQKETHKRVS